MKIEDFIDRYFYKEWVQDLLERANLSSRGIKKELIIRLMQESDYDIFQLLNYPYTDDLKDICFDLKIHRSGRKYELVRRILEEISKDWNNEYFIIEMIKAKKNQGWSDEDLKQILGYLYDRYEKNIHIFKELEVSSVETILDYSPKSYNELEEMIAQIENTEQIEILKDIINNSCQTEEITSRQRNILLKKLVKSSQKFKDQETALRIGPWSFGWIRRKR